MENTQCSLQHSPIWWNMENAGGFMHENGSDEISIREWHKCSEINISKGVNKLPEIDSCFLSFISSSINYL